jgi:phage terminase large subunit-like protein
LSSKIVKPKRDFGSLPVDYPMAGTDPEKDEPFKDKRLERDFHPDDLEIFIPKDKYRSVKKEVLTFDGWAKRAMKTKDQEMARLFWACAYANAKDQDTAFYQYSKHICGFKDMTPKFHGPIVDALMEPGRYKMIQAARGTFKSCIGVQGFGAWTIGKEAFNTGHSSVRILLASEVLGFASVNLRKIRQVMSWNKSFQNMYGDHRSKDDWGSTSLTSEFRMDPRLAEPTVSIAGLGSDRTGMHFDKIICDDLQARRSVTSVEQIEQCYEFYRLLYSLLEPEGQMFIIGTRWDYDDIYARIEQENEETGLHQFSILKQAAREPATVDGTPTFPTRLSEEELQRLRKQQGNYVFSCQYLLDPVPASDRTFKEEWIQYTPDEVRTRYDKEAVYVTAGDFAYTVQKMVDQGKVKRADWTVVATARIGADWSYQIVDLFRKRCTKDEGLRELFRQAQEWNSTCAALQKYDRAQIEEAYHQLGFELGWEPFPEWISYPSRMDKNNRIETALQGLFMAGKVYIPAEAGWLKDELLRFPKGTKDGLDVLCNLVKVAAPGATRHESKEKAWRTKFDREVFEEVQPNTDW